jgi:hypothetical protein
MTALSAGLLWVGVGNEDVCRATYVPPRTPVTILYIFTYISFLLHIKLSGHSLSDILHNTFLLLDTPKIVVNLLHCGAAAALSRHEHQCTGEYINITILTSHDYIVCHITVGGGGLKGWV